VFAVADVGGEEFPKALAGGFGAEKNCGQLVGRGHADEGELAAGAGKLSGGESWNQYLLTSFIPHATDDRRITPCAGH
jgi:hypothetical protein